MTEIYGSNMNPDHPYHVVWSNSVVTLKVGHGSEPSARHYARLIENLDVGTVVAVTGPNGPITNWETEGTAVMKPALFHNTGDAS
jgi:hypothetical protein